MTFAEDIQEKIPDITKSIESINNDILDLEVSYELNEVGVNISQDLADISNALLYHEYQIVTPKTNNGQWNESE